MLPPAGPAVPRLPVGRLQVCLRVPRLFDRTQPRMGRHQVRRIPKPFLCLPAELYFLKDSYGIPAAAVSSLYGRVAG